MFFGFDILCRLVLQSGLPPSAIGAVSALDGMASVIFSFGDILAPAAGGLSPGSSRRALLEISCDQL